MHVFADTLSAIPSMLGTMILLFSTVTAGLLACHFHARFHGYNLWSQALDNDNSAALIRVAGFVTALVIAVRGGYQPQFEFLPDLYAGFKMTVVAVVALGVSLYINDYAIMSNVRNSDEIFRGKNLAVSIVECSSFIATAMIFSGAQQRTLVTNLVLFVVGQIILVLIARLYAQIASHVFEQVEKGNVGCALSLSGFLLSGGVAASAATHTGSETDWQVVVVTGIIALMIWAALMTATRLYFSAWVRKDRLEAEITNDNNWSMGLLSGLSPVLAVLWFASVHIN